MDDLFSLYFALQIQVYMQKFQYECPASSEIYLNELMGLIEFKVLNPETLIQIWYPEFIVKDLIVGAKK